MRRRSLVAGRPRGTALSLRVILRNIFSTWTSYLVTLLSGFMLAPFVVHHLGNAGYGVWTLVLSLTGYFGVLDLGIRQSVGRFVARYVALQDSENVNRTVSTALIMLGGGGLLALLATIVASLNFGAFKVEHHFASIARVTMLIGGLTVSFALPMSVFGAILVSLDRFDVMTGVVVSETLLRAALVVTALSHGYGLVTLASITLITSGIEYLVMAAWAKALYPPLKPSWAVVDFAMCRVLFGFGIYRFLWIVANQVIFYTDSVVIGIFLSVGTITSYAIAGSLVNYGRNVVSLAIDTLYPTATRLDAKNDLHGLRELQIFGTRIGLLVGLPLCIGFVTLGRQFITLWMGSAYAMSASVLGVLTIAQFTSMSQYISAMILVGMARHKALAYIAAGEGVANLVLSIILVREIGLMGVAWGTTIPHLVTTALIIPLYTLRALDMNPMDYFRQAFVRPIICALPIAAAGYMFSLYVNPTWHLFAAEVLTLVSVFATLAYFICLTAKQRDALKAGLGSILRRKAVAHGA